jgi:hypothetical protein
MTEIYLGARIQLETEHVTKAFLDETDIDLRKSVSIDRRCISRAEAHRIVDVFFDAAGKLSQKEP